MRLTCASAPTRGFPKVGRSTTGRSSGVSLRSTYTSPVVPEGSAGDARFGHGFRLPGSAADGATTGRPATVPSGPVLSANRPPFPKLDAAPVARTSALAPFTLTRLPVPSLDDASDRMVPWEQLGCPMVRSVPRCPWSPASRQLGPPKLLLRSPPRLPGARRFAACSSTRRPGCPVLVASERGFSPRRSRLRLVNQSRFPSARPEGVARRTRSSSSGWRALPGTRIPSRMR